MTIYGYARVSTDGQTLAAQQSELTAAGCVKVFAEKVSGAKSDRIELAKLLKRIDAGDVLIVTRLDRLARSTRDLLNILDAISRSGAKFKSLHDPCFLLKPFNEDPSNYTRSFFPEIVKT